MIVASLEGTTGAGVGSAASAAGEECHRASGSAQSVVAVPAGAQPCKDAAVFDPLWQCIVSDYDILLLT